MCKLLGGYNEDRDMERVECIDGIQRNCVLGNCGYYRIGIAVVDEEDEQG